MSPHATGPLPQVRAAFGLLTRLPVGSSTTPGAAAFPLVGLVVGLLGAIPIAVLGGREPVLGAIAGLAVIALITGFLHLDGFADTVDALLVTDRSRAEAARKDPAIGAGGAAALILLLGAQIAAISSIATGVTGTGMGDGAGLAAVVLIAGATIARAVPVVAIRLAARGDQTVAGSADGSGAWFAHRVRDADAVLAAGAAAFIVAALGVLAAATGTAPSDLGADVGRAIWLASAVGAIVGLIATGLVAFGRHGLDGDGLGASVELTMLAVLASFAFLVA